MKRPILLLISLISLSVGAYATESASLSELQNKPLKLWYDKAAPDNNKGWATASIPHGNGYMGLNIFGGVMKERIQITENSLFDHDFEGGFSRPGLNNFAEVYIDFPHNSASNYHRELDLNEGTSSVRYESGGVTYQRDFFSSYPDKVSVVRLSASKESSLSFTLRPTIPYLAENKTGEVKAEGDTITLSGLMHDYQIHYEGQFKVIPMGGTMKTTKQGTIEVIDASSAVIIMAVGTNYKIDPQVFLEDELTKKLDGFPHPHEKVSKYLENASKKSFPELLAAHKEDYKELLHRVTLDLGAAIPDITTDKLVDAYPKGKYSLYLEELAFHYGRYLLICSSRQGTLPPNLQGIWNVYKNPPWASQYLHDTNVQMAYAPVFNTNLPELFKSYADFFKAFQPRQQKYATQYVKQFNRSELAADGNNGWSGPFWASPYKVPGKSQVAGFGTGSWIGLMFWDYYDFTRDKKILSETVYPVMYEQANFVSRFVQEIDGKLLAKPSSSPEQKYRNTIGTTFDQQMFYENHHNTLKAAKILGKSDERLPVYKQQLPLLDPIIVGKSGQIKEFRDEEYYGEGPNIDPHHRHTSMLLGQYPGQLINSTTPAWLDAVEVSLTKRTNKSNIGWARAERVAFWARVYDGDEAYIFYQDLLEGNFLHNLFNDHRGGPLFQADGNYGASAGVAELLMQSQDYIIAPLPALPSAWPNGSYRGLLARGNFEVSTSWQNSQATRIEVLSKAGGTLRLRYPKITGATLTTASGATVEAKKSGHNLITIESKKGETYIFTKIPLHQKVSAPQKITIAENGASKIQLSWDAAEGAASYNLYRAVGSAPDYELVESGVTERSFRYEPTDLKNIDQMTLKVIGVNSEGIEAQRGATTVWLKQ